MRLTVLEQGSSPPPIRQRRVHGEERGREALAAIIEKRFRIRPEPPRHMETVDI